MDNVEEKLIDTNAKRKRSGKGDRVYLLSHVLQFEDGSTYYGAPGKSRQYFYYYCKGAGPNIRCEEIEKIVIDRIKAYFKGNEIFARLVEDAVKKRINELPKIDHEISRLQKELQDLEDENRTLREQLKDKEQRSRSGFMDWLEEEVEKLKSQKNQKEQVLANFLYARADLMEKSGLESLEKTAMEFIAKFDELTGIQKRSFIERMIAKIVIKQDNKLELHVLWDPRQKKSPELFQPGDYCVTRTTTSSVRERSGGPSPSLLELWCRPYESVDTLEFYHTPPYHNKIVLHQKYVVEGLSIRQIAKEFLSSKEAVRMGLITAGIPLRKVNKPHGRQSQPKYGGRRINGAVVEYKQEQKVITAAMQMREQGLSLRQIAKNLSAMSIPTKCDGKKWHPEMIKRILNSEKCAF